MSARQTAVERWAVTESKVCSRCNKRKPMCKFTIRETGKWKGCPVSQCKACCVKRQTAAYNNETYHRVMRPWQLKNKYGITQDDYERMLNEQGGVCKICGTDDPKTPRGYVTFAIDHCHETGNVRGLLCNPCNRALGLLKEDTNILQKAIYYLQCK